jgi:hypothetical protein
LRCLWRPNTRHSLSSESYAQPHRPLHHRSALAMELVLEGVVVDELIDKHQEPTRVTRCWWWTRLTVSTSAWNSCSPGSLPPPVEVAAARRDEPEKEQGRERHVRGLPRGGLCGPGLTQRVAARLVRALDADPDPRNPAGDRSSATRPSSRWCGATTSSPIPRASRCQKTTAFTARSVNHSNTARTTPVPRRRRCNSCPRRVTRVTANARSRRAGACRCFRPATY